MGIAFIAFGIFPILIGMGVVTPGQPGVPPPAWVPVCAGLLFVAAGAAIIVDFAFARTGPDGQLAPDTPLPVRAASLAVALTTVAMLAAVFGWVAFGSGPRQFTSTLAMPFGTTQRQSGALSGRIVFGIATIAILAVFGAGGAVGIRRLWREYRGSRPNGAERR